MPIFGNAILVSLGRETLDDYGTPSPASTPTWHGRQIAQVVDRVRTVVTAGGEVNRIQETLIAIPSRTIADDGTYLTFQPGDYLTIEQDGAQYAYRVAGFNDTAERVLGSPTDVLLIAERRAF